MNDITTTILISSGIIILAFFACLRLYKNLKAVPLNPSLLIHETTDLLMQANALLQEAEDKLTIAEKIRSNHNIRHVLYDIKNTQAAIHEIATFLPDAYNTLPNPHTPPHMPPNINYDKEGQLRQDWEHAHH